MRRGKNSWYGARKRSPKVWSGRGIHPDERPTAEQLSPHLDDPVHGDEGHIGYRCYQCAQVSTVRVLLQPNSGDYWQTMQINWQEQCDLLQHEYDVAVGEHYKVHIPAMLDANNECECPIPPDMPPKPIMPAERALSQRADR